MIITENIKIPAKEAHEKTVKRYQCDFCSFQSESMPTCSVCKRHACRQLMKQCIKYDPFSLSDYSDAFCPICYELRFEKYAAQFIKADNDYDEEKEKLWDKIREESLK